VRSISLSIPIFGLCTSIAIVQAQTPPASTTAQIKQAVAGTPFIVLTPIAPTSPVTALVDVFLTCSPSPGSSLLKPNTQHAVLSSADISLALVSAPVAGTSICAIETYSGTGAPPPTIFPVFTVTAAAPVPAPDKPHRVTVAIETPTPALPYILVDPVAPSANQTAKLGVYSNSCDPPGTNLLDATEQGAVGQSDDALTLHLTAPPKSQDTFCAVETFSGTPAKATLISELVTVPSPVPPLTAAMLEAEDQDLRAQQKICITKRDTACLKNLKYDSFVADSKKAISAGIAPTAGQNWKNDYLHLGEYGDPFKYPADGEPFAFSLGDWTGNVTHVRVMAGVDVSAASSADPAAKFLFDATLDIPIPAMKGTNSLDARNWLWGYARLSSIAQPGAVSGISNLTTYVSALTAASPNQIVQSFEATGGYEYRIHTFDDNWHRRPILLSFIAEGGIITPLSNSQNGTPTIYIATSALQSYYASLAAGPNPTSTNTENAANISAACAAVPPNAAPTCYIAQYTQDRSHFFRNYSGGLRVKRFYYNEDNESYIFPANFDFTIGQNEYVTGGELHRWVAHFGGSTPISGIPGLYVYAVFDLVLTKNAVQGQQFSLETAGSTITPSSPNVADIYVVQPDRDRYRFGVAYDLGALAKSLAKKYLSPTQ
jgi:hypothetical protein